VCRKRTTTTAGTVVGAFYTADVQEMDNRRR
jgi:hypothetical protein